MWGRDQRVVVERVVRVGVALALAVGGVAAGCSDDGEEGRPPTATVPRPTTTTTAALDEVPETIDVAYAQRVMDALDRVLGEAIRGMAAAKAVTPDVETTLRAVYGDPQFSPELDDYREDAQAASAAFEQPPGDPTTRVVDILDSSRDCVLMRVTRSFAAVFAGPPTEEDSQDSLVQLLLKEQERDPAMKNPTAWVIVADGFVEGEPPKDPCK